MIYNKTKNLFYSLCIAYKKAQGQRPLSQPEHEIDLHEPPAKGHEGGQDNSRAQEGASETIYFLPHTVKPVAPLALQCSLALHLHHSVQIVELGPSALKAHDAV